MYAADVSDVEAVVVDSIVVVGEVAAGKNNRWPFINSNPVCAMVWLRVHMGVYITRVGLSSSVYKTGYNVSVTKSEHCKFHYVDT